MHYQEGITTGTLARLVFEMPRVGKRFDFSCSNPPCVHMQGCEHGANAPMQEWQKHKKEA
jgi:hypothetical protein